VREDLTRDALKEKKIVEKINQIHLQVHEKLKKSEEKYKARHDQHIIKRKCRVGDIAWIQLNMEML
jgi:chaperonin GroEL (HSP60 family)